MSDRTADKQIALGGGCHWCTEAVFQALRGVTAVEQGFAKSKPPADTWSEAVRVTYDPTVIMLADLIEIHLRTHAATSDHSFRETYRSAVYPVRPDDLSEAERALADAAATFSEPIITKTLVLADFKPSDARFHDYYRTDPTRPFCRAYIDPKLTLLRQRYARHLRDVGEG